MISSKQVYYYGGLIMASGQGFIQKNWAPRVQINYDVEVYGAQKSAVALCNGGLV
jgi:hypothetical protein